MFQNTRMKKKKSRHRKIELVPLKNKEEHASSKDLVSGANTAGESNHDQGV